MSDPEPTEERASPMLGQMILLVVFLALTVVGVTTVVVPELSSDPEVEEGATAEVEDETGGEETAEE